MTISENVVSLQRCLKLNKTITNQNNNNIKNEKKWKKQKETLKQRMQQQ